MIFTPQAVPGVFVVQAEPHRDGRGSFARTYCEDEFADHGLELTIVQCAVSSNPVKGTLRGMHFQVEPEPKLVRCTRGLIFDVAIDLRPSSATFCRWVGARLDAESCEALFIPAGCAHGFLTLERFSEVSYMIGAHHAPALGRGLRWDDPAFGVEWPSRPTVISDRDATYPDFTP